MTFSVMDIRLLNGNRISAIFVPDEEFDTQEVIDELSGKRFNGTLSTDDWGHVESVHAAKILLGLSTTHSVRSDADALHVRSS